MRLKPFCGLPAAPRRDGIQRRHLCSDSIGNRFQETAVLLERRTITFRDRLSDVFLNRRRNQFHPADENTRDLGRSGLDVEREDGIDHALGNDVEQSRTFFKPGIAPCVHHGLRFLSVKAFHHENLFETLQAASLSGTWTIQGEGTKVERSTVSPISGTLMLGQKGQQVTGTWKAPRDTWRISGEIKDGRFVLQNESKEMAVTRNGVQSSDTLLPRHAEAY